MTALPAGVTVARDSFGEVDAKRKEVPPLRDRTSERKERKWCEDFMPRST